MVHPLSVDVLGVCGDAVGGAPEIAQQDRDDRGIGGEVDVKVSNAQSRRAAEQVQGLGQQAGQARMMPPVPLADQGFDPAQQGRPGVAAGEDRAPRIESPNRRQHLDLRLQPLERRVSGLVVRLAAGPRRSCPRSSLRMNVSESRGNFFRR